MSNLQYSTTTPITTTTPTMAPDPETETETDSTIPPPPYTPPTPTFLCSQLLNELHQREEEDEETTEEEEPEPTKTTSITLNAPITIHGHGNIISFPMAEYTKMAACIVAAVQKTNEGRERGNISIHLNCGITVQGQRNVVGSVAGVVGRAQAAANASGAMKAAAGAGSKRKPEGDVEEGPVAKRVDVEGDVVQMATRLREGEASS